MRGVLTMTRIRRSGFTLNEVLISLVILAIIGSALQESSRIRLGISRIRRAQNGAQRPRAGTNLLVTDLRAVQDSGGVDSVGIEGKFIRILVPYRFGLVCGTNSSVTTVSMLPVDSATIAMSVYKGFAWRNATGATPTSCRRIQPDPTSRSRLQPRRLHRVGVRTSADQDCFDPDTERQPSRSQVDGAIVEPLSPPRSSSSRRSRTPSRDQPHIRTLLACIATSRADWTKSWSRHSSTLAARFRFTSQVMTRRASFPPINRRSVGSSSCLPR